MPVSESEEEVRVGVRVGVRVRVRVRVRIKKRVYITSGLVSVEKQYTSG
jgi:hypothetical protein